MIDVKKVFSSNNVTLTLYIYTELTYTISVNGIVLTNNSITVSKTTPNLVFTIEYSNATTEEVIVNIADSMQEYIFNIGYGIPISREHIYLHSYIKKYFQGWSTAGTTSHSSISRILGPLILSIFNRDIELILDIVKEDRNYFPLNKDCFVYSEKPEMELSEIYNIPFSHLTNFKEEPVNQNILSVGYANGGDTIIGNMSRGEKIFGLNDYLYQSDLVYGKNNAIEKRATGFINSQKYKQFIFDNALPVKISIDGTLISIENENGKYSYRSSIIVDKCIVTPFGDIFILSGGKLYYAKTEVTTINLESTNPSINNNNIVEIGSDYFSPGEDIEIVVDTEYLVGLKANSIIIKVENQDSAFYIIGDEAYSSVESRISDIGRKNIKFVLSTESTDDYILVSVYVDYNPVPYIAYSSGLKLNSIQINNNTYNDLYVENNMIIVTRTSGEKYRLTSTYASCFFDTSEGKYVSIKT
jgi:hypothetical protein